MDCNYRGGPGCTAAAPYMARQLAHGVGNPRDLLQQRWLALIESSGGRAVGLEARAPRVSCRTSSRRPGCATGAPRTSPANLTSSPPCSQPHRPCFRAIRGACQQFRPLWSASSETNASALARSVRAATRSPCAQRGIGDARAFASERLAHARWHSSRHAGSRCPCARIPVLVSVLCAGPLAR